MAAYDSSVIQKAADELYLRANTIVLVNAALFAFVGGAAGAFAFGGAGALIGFLGGGGLGYYFGVQKAFALKLQAQTALCQVAIERNTRGPGGGTEVQAQPQADPSPRTESHDPVQPVPPDPMRFCTGCGTKISLTASACPKCKAVF